MVPRTVQMAAAVAAQFTTSQLEDYGNIILNGYATTGPNSTGKLAWQYNETTSPPAPLPSVTTVRPALRGWTNNYQEYYTQLQPNGYGVNPGDPTMFEYAVHSYTQGTGPISALVGTSQGTGYALGTYLAVPLTGGTGSGATANIVVTVPGGVAIGPANAVSFVSGGSGYPPGFVLFSGSATTTLTGSGSGLTVDGSSNANMLLGVTAVASGGTGYEVGDTYYVTPGTGVGRVDAVNSSGSVTSLTLVNSGTGYSEGDTLQAPALPGGSGFFASAAAVNSVPGTGGVPRWSQPPRRFFQNQTSAVTPPQNVNNPEVIPYSFIYPVADNPTPPPIDTL